MQKQQLIEFCEQMKVEAMNDNIANGIFSAGPWLRRSLITERDQYMVHNLKKTVAEHPDADIVVVVGAAHIPGMLKEWEIERTPEDQAALIATISRHTEDPQDVGFTKRKLREYAAYITSDQVKQLE
eukprot:gene26661-33275_t